MCEQGVQVLVRTLDHLNCKGADASQFSVLLSSAYEGDICYFKHLISVSNAPYLFLLRSFKSVEIVIVDAVNSLEADIVILSSTRTALDERGKPQGSQWWTAERVKGACTRHRKFFVLLGSPRWMKANFDNAFVRVWEKVVQLQCLPQNQPDAASPLSVYWR
eukprot:RCo042023